MRSALRVIKGCPVDTAYNSCYPVGMNETSTPNNKTVKAVIVFPRTGSAITSMVTGQAVTVSGGLKLLTENGPVEINPSEVSYRAWTKGNGYNYEMKDGRGISIFW